MDIAEKLNAAIDRSMSHNEIVRVEVDDLEDAILTLSDGDCEIDHVATDNGTEVWGWTEQTPANKMDWRLLLVVA